MRRVVVTGLGVVSCLGNSKAQVLDSLRAGRSGISFNDRFDEAGMRSKISGSVDIDLSELIDRKVKRFMGDAAAYSYVALQQAIDDAGLEDADVSNPMTGLIAGSGGASSANQFFQLRGGRFRHDQFQNDRSRASRGGNMPRPRA